MRSVGSRALFVDYLRFFDERRADACRARQRHHRLQLAAAAQSLEAALESFDGPEQIDGGGARSRERLANRRRIPRATRPAISAFECCTPSAMPIAAATPIAGAPRITMSLIALRDVRGSRCRCGRSLRPEAGSWSSITTPSGVQRMGSTVCNAVLLLRPLAQVVRAECHSILADSSARAGTQRWSLRIAESARLRSGAQEMAKTVRGDEKREKQE